MSIAALTNYLKPFQRFFSMPGVSEICINRPLGAWVEQYGHFTYYEVPQFSMDFLLQFACLVGEYNQREISPEHPTLSSVLPDGSRVQFVIEPACEKGSFICAIRRQSIAQTSLENYFNAPLLSHQSPDCPDLLHLYRSENYFDFLKLAVLQKKNIIISGGTSTGKTTFLNALLHHVPFTERLITIETDREVQTSHPNTVHLLSAQDGKSRSDITMLELLKASLRLRPDRILVSELRAEEAFPYLRAINSGHPGSFTTLHADSPQGCFEQLVFMAMQSGNVLSHQDWFKYIKSIVHIVVQIKRNAMGERAISEIYFNEAEAFNGAVQQSLVS